MTDTQVTQTIAEVGELGTPATNVSQVILEVAGPPPAEPAAVGSAGGAAAPGISLPRGERVLWTVDDRSVEVTWGGLTARANGGYEQADLIIPTGDGRWRGVAGRGAPKTMGQGSIVRAYRESGDILWEGMVAAEPTAFQGEVKFWAVGAVEILRRNATRLPFQLAGGSGWVDRGSDPFNYANNAKYDTVSQDKFLKWTIGTTEAYANGNKAGFALMVANWSLNRIAFTLNKTANDSNFDLELYIGDDAGTLTLEKQWSMGSGHPDGDLIDYTIPHATQGNTLSLVLTANGATTPAAKNRIYLTKLRVNGIGNDDDTTTSDVVQTLANKCDYRSTGITGSGSAALPLDYEGSWADLASTMAEIDDWRWTVLYDPSHAQFGNLNYGPYGGEDGERTWYGVQGEGLDCSSVIMLPRYNHVDVNYESPAGVLQTLQRDATDVTDLLDPLSEDVFPFPEPFSLEDPQDNAETAKMLADAALQKLTKLRAQGSITVSRLLNGAPYDILPGDLMSVGGFNPRLPPQRIASVTYQPGGTCRIDVERSITVQDLVLRTFRKRIRRNR